MIQDMTGQVVKSRTDFMAVFMSFGYEISGIGALAIVPSLPLR